MQYGHESAAPELRASWHGRLGGEKRLAASAHARLVPTYDGFWDTHKQKKCPHTLALQHFKQTNKRTKTDSNNISNSPKLRTTQIPINNIVSKLIVIHVV